LEAACQAAFGRTLELEFLIDEELGRLVEQPVHARAANGQGNTGSPNFGSANNRRAGGRSGSAGRDAGDGDAARSVSCRPPAHKAFGACRAVAAEEAEQVSGGDGAPLEQSSSTPRSALRRPLQTLETFVVGQSNCLAFKSLEMALAKPGHYSPLFVHGPTGVGKTHLLEGLLAAYRKQRRAAVSLSAEQFTSQFVEAMNGGGLPSFRRKYRDVSLLVIDDVQFFAGKRATLAELLYTIDTLLRGGAQVALAADRSPAALKALGPELVARLQGGMVCPIEPPEYATRLGIVARLARELEVDAPASVQAFIARRFTSQSRELAGALKRLHAASHAHDRPITESFAEEALAELLHQHARAVRLSDIEKAICEVFGLEAESLQSDRKSKAVSHPRMLAMWLARKHTRAALSEIGQYFGRKSHSTVISAQKKIDAWISQGETLALRDRAWNLDEAVRRVEEQMRAG
jgi:chromosomal replication initiator protein